MLQKWLPPWGVRDALLVLLGGSLVALSLGISMVTLLLRVHASGAGPLAATALLLCLSLPTILTMGLAGSLADRIDSRTLIVSTLVVEAAALVGLAVLDSLVATFALAAVVALAGALSRPVWTALLPLLAGEEHTAQLVSAQQGLNSIALPLGSGIAGVVVQTLGEAIALGLAAGATSLAAVITLGVRTRRAPLEPEAVSLLPAAALRTLRGHHVAFVLVIALVPFVIAVEAVGAVEVFLVRDVLAATPAQFGLTAVATGVGSVLGAIAAGTVADPARRVPVTLWALGLTAAIQVGQGLAPGFVVFLVLCLAIGIAVGLANALAVVVILDRTPEAARGRVIALVTGLLRTGTVVATVLGGALATAIGPRLTFVSTGALGLAAALAAAYAIGRASRQPKSTETECATLGG